jgi:hypothetical protein
MPPLPYRLRSEGEPRREIERVPGGAEVVGSKEIDESRAANLKDVLDFVPGVLVRPRFGAADESQLSIRGSGLRSNFHLRSVNVLIDGFLYGNADGFSDFESLELLSTKYIEVYEQYNYQDFDHPLSCAIIDDVTNSWGTEMRYLDSTPLLGYRNRFTIVEQYFGTRQTGERKPKTRSTHEDVSAGAGRGRRPSDA